MIEFYFGLPGEGKSFCVTKIAMDRIRKGRMVYSNYPIMFNEGKKQFTSYVWDDKFVYEPLHDCDIVIDEGYRVASSRDWKSFTVDEHTFYGTTGHNGIDVYFITQAIPRIEVIIRELVSKFHHIQKTTIPWFSKDPRGYYEKVLWFVDDVYLQDNKTPGTPGKERYTASHIFFTQAVGKAYDTKYYRSKGSITHTPITWAEKLNFPGVEKTKKVFDSWLKKFRVKVPEHDPLEEYFEDIDLDEVSDVFVGESSES